MRPVAAGLASRTWPARGRIHHDAKGKSQECSKREPDGGDGSAAEDDQQESEPQAGDGACDSRVRSQQGHQRHCAAPVGLNPWTPPKVKGLDLLLFAELSEQEPGPLPRIRAAPSRFTRDAG
jgi:hypothetical protein